MNLRAMMRVGLGASLALAVACSKDEKKVGSESPEVANTGSQAGAAATTVPEADPLAKKAERPKEVLLDAPVERRLYSDRIEASSFAWGNYNRFHENYHPNYLMDGDPKTTWLEDADGNGIGEWVRIVTSPIAGSTKLRLRMQNGYHKSESLFEKNSRVKSMEIKVLPEGPTKTVAVADSMDWQEFEVEFDAQKFEGVELKMLEAYGGTKYEDLCITDVEIYVTGLTPENPAFEAKKLTQVKEWKASRLEAAKMFEDAAANELPIKSGYNVVTEKLAKRISGSDDYGAAVQMLGALRDHAGDSSQYIDRAEEAVKTRFVNWKHYRPVIKKPIKIPDVDGLVSFREDRSRYGWLDHTVELPAMQNGKSLVQNRRVALFEAKDKNVDENNECNKGWVHAQRPPDAVGPNADQVLVWRCFEEEEREGVYRYASWQLLQYDTEGWLRVAVDRDGAHVFHWEQGAEGTVLASATRVTRWGRGLAHLRATEGESEKQQRLQ